MAEPINPHNGIERVPNAQTASLRHQHVRTSNYIEEYPRRTFLAHNQFWTHDEDGQPIPAPAQLPNAFNADNWGPQMRVIGFERVTLLVDLLEGGGTITGLNVRVQVGHLKDSEAQAVAWFDLADDRVTPGTLELREFSYALTADGRIAFQIPTCGVYMRFQLYADGTTAADTHGRIQAIRHMDAS